MYQSYQAMYITVVHRIEFGKLLACLVIAKISQL